MFQFLVFILILMCLDSECAKILGVFPTPSISHQVVFHPVMHELAKRGHEVTVITPDPAFSKDQAPPNLTEIDVHDISYEHWNNLIVKLGNEKNTVTFINLLLDLLMKLVVIQIKSDEVQNLLNDNKNFDLIFVESYVRPALIFSHIYNAPVIEFSSLGGILSALEMIGAATHPLIYPNAMHKRLFNLTLWEKVKNLYAYYATEYNIIQHVHTENEMLKTIFGPNIPDLNDLRRNVRMMFLNVHPIWDLNRPVPPNVVYLGGLHQNPQKELPKNWKSYLDSSQNGVIYVSFGTNVKPSMFPPEKLKIFTDVFSQLPYDVLWKWDKDELPERPKNVRISKWLPQSDLLRHPKVKLFITQGGLQSTDEAITAGVPIIGIPMLGDQWFNVEQYVKLSIGKKILLETMTHTKLMDAIKKLIEDESYRQNIVTLRGYINDQPQSPLERAVWWAEHVLRHGGDAYMRAPGANLHWTKYYELEVVLVILTACVLITVTSILMIRFIISNVRYYCYNKVKVN